MITVFAWYTLCELRPPQTPHLLCVKPTEIHGLADVTISFIPGIAYFENFECREFIPPALQNVRRVLEQLRAFFNARPRPFFERGGRSFHGTLGLGNSRFTA